jgi:hypothetical protein
VSISYLVLAFSSLFHRHCQDLERENARLKAGLAQQSPSKKLKSDEPEPSQDVLTELARLRESNAQLAAQNAQLSAQNAQLAAENARLSQHEVQPKVEDDENALLLSEPSARREKESKEKHGTGSVALMVSCLEAKHDPHSRRTFLLICFQFRCS